MMKRNVTMKSLAALAALFAITPVMQAATINFSSLETVLADPEDKNSKMSALWTGWVTQLYEYNMPFIQLANESDAPYAIQSYTMTIGDTDYEFSNEFWGKDNTNSYPFAANGEYAITGFSTPDVDFTTSIADDGDTLVIDFGPDGLAPGEVVRFQVDIDADDDAPQGTMMYADYTSVFFEANGGDDISGNSDIELAFIDTDITAQVTLPNPSVDASIAQFFQAPRPYSQMQMTPQFPATPFDVIPEPTTGMLAGLAMAGLVARRRS